MTEKAMNTGTVQDKETIWSGRYRVAAKVDNWKHKGRIYEDQIMTLFQVDMDDDEAKTLLESSGFTPEKDGEDYMYLVSQVAETFTEDQADKLIAYLETFAGITAWKKPAYKPIKGHAGAGVMAVGGNADFYMFTEYDNYNLDFKAWAYYRVDYKDNRLVPETVTDKLKDQMLGLSLNELQEVRDWLEAIIERKRQG